MLTALKLLYCAFAEVAFELHASCLLTTNNIMCNRTGTLTPTECCTGLPIYTTFTWRFTVSGAATDGKLW